jgi:folylpolyglutamate synthase/dihydropteroate synthase
VLNEFATDPAKSSRRLIVVCGYSKTKNITKMLEMLAENPNVKQVFPVSSQHFRLLPVDQLQEKITAI